MSLIVSGYKELNCIPSIHTFAERLVFICHPDVPERCLFMSAKVKPSREQIKGQFAVKMSKGHKGKATSCASILKIPF